MPKTLEEKYLDWLQREEEILGIDAMLRASEDFEYARVLLHGELGLWPTDAQIKAFQGAGTMRYEQLPQIGITRVNVGTEEIPFYQFTDIVSGRFVRTSDVMASLTYVFP